MRVCVPGYQNRGFKSCGNDSEVFDAAEITANQEESSEAASDRSCLQEREGHSSHKPLERLPTAPAFAMSLTSSTSAYNAVTAVRNDSVPRPRPHRFLRVGPGNGGLKRPAMRHTHTHCTPVVQHSDSCTALIRAQGEVVTQV